MDVKTAGRTLEIFEAFAREQAPLSLTDLSRQLGSPLSSCLYLVRTLERLGYIYAVGGKKTLYPTRKLYEVASSIVMGEPWVERLEPRLGQLRDETRETVILGKRQGAKVVYLAVFEGPETIRYVAQPGDLKPLHSSAIGKALLAAMAPAELARILPKIPMHSVTPSTITDREALLADLAATRERGCAVTRAENVPDVAALAQAFNLAGDTYGLALAGPLYRIEAALERQQARLAQACTDIAAR
jgi:DNA-binding IclR family transcriptional regulator